MASRDDHHYFLSVTRSSAAVVQLETNGAASVERMFKTSNRTNIYLKCVTSKAEMAA